jgi:hypothetical protein
MLEYLKRIVALVRSSGFDLPPRHPPEDPYAGVRQPKGGRPPGGTTAVAVAEPDEAADVRAIGRHLRA